jgi:hypothetical protein
MLIIIFEYTCNMVIHMHSKYTFVSYNIPNYIPQNTQKIYLCILVRLQLNWSHLQLMGHKLLFLNENQIKCCSHGRMQNKIVTN